MTAKEGLRGFGLLDPKVPPGPDCHTPHVGKSEVSGQGRKPGASRLSSQVRCLLSKDSGV